MIFVETCKGFLKWPLSTSLYQSHFRVKVFVLQTTADVNKISESVQVDIVFILNLLSDAVNNLA